MTQAWTAQYAEAADEVIRYSALVYQRGLVSAAGGNVSARQGDRIVITGSNVPLRAVTPEGLVLCGSTGQVLEAAPGLRPSKETRFHLAVYRARPQMRYVIHAHPVFSTIWSMQNKPLPLYTKSAQLKLVHVPVIPEGIPGSAQLADSVAQAVETAPEACTAFLMAAHGALVMGETMEACFHQLELLEDTAKIAVFQGILTKEG